MTCLVTTLKGVVNDDSLLCMGDIVLDAMNPDTSTSENFPPIFIAYDGMCKCVAFGGNFLSSSGEDLGPEIAINAPGGSFIAGGSVTRVVLRGGYGCLTLRPQVATTTGKYFSVNTDSLRYQNKLTSFTSGDKSPFKLNGKVSDFVSAHQNIALFSHTDYLETEIPLSLFGALKNLVSLNLNGTYATGSTDDLAGAESLENIFLGYRSADTPISGDLSKLPGKVSVFSVQETGDSYTWETQRSADTCPISLLSVRLGSYIDAALTNMAACTKEPPSTVTKRMTLIGTRTSASDEAVATLQTKGWTITVTEA